MKDLDGTNKIRFCKKLFIKKNHANLSPYTNFVYMATDLTGTGLHSLRYFHRAASEYSKIFNDYKKKKLNETWGKIRRSTATLFWM